MASGGNNLSVLPGGAISGLEIKSSEANRPDPQRVANFLETVRKWMENGRTAADMREQSIFMLIE